jgi:DNA repair protein RecN (Recombination protein N)
MLEELEIFNFALVQEARLEFDAAFNVLTGETGAGKSIVLDALGFLLGGQLEQKASTGCRVQGRFRVRGAARALLDQWGMDDGDEVVLSREISAGGRSVTRINSRMSTLGNLRELGEHLVDLHGQHQHYSLLRPSRHLELLDRSLGENHLERVEAYIQAHRQTAQLKSELEALRQAERDRNRELEWLEHELSEIDGARLRPDEEDGLLTEARRLAGASELAAGAAQVAEMLAHSGLDRAERHLRALTRHDPPGIEPLATRLGEAAMLLQECCHELTAYSEELGSNPARLEEVESRLDLLRGLKRKYGADLPEVLEYAAQARSKRDGLLQAEARGQELEHELELARAHRDELGAQLSLERRRAAKKLAREVEGELKGLGLEGTRFEVRLEACEAGPAGLERAEFMLAPNPGVPPLPLARIASGGELSRLMLALVAVFSRFEPIPTLVFDEVDAGLGGRAAEAVSTKLRELSQRCQVLTVTHLAVLAAAATRHFRLSKHASRGQTRIAVEALKGDGRERELARMLSGDASPDTARQHAKQLLATVA